MLCGADAQGLIKVHQPASLPLAEGEVQSIPRPQGWSLCQVKPGSCIKAQENRFSTRRRSRNTWTLCQASARSAALMSARRHPMASADASSVSTKVEITHGWLAAPCSN